jgi:thiol-disulfide isomerase/thioredoxin
MDRLGLVRTTLAAAALLLLPTGLHAQYGGVSLPLGTEGPPATVEDLEGNPVDRLELIDGRPALLEFWATWCPLCAELQPQLDQLHANYGDDIALVAVGVAVNQNPRRILRHLEANDPGYPHLYDARGDAVRAYQAPTTSVVVILDAQGRVTYTGVGRDQDLVAAMERAIEAGG